jgi:sigma-E factor negative regulatory protein RseC
LARFFGQRQQQHYAHNPLHAKPGDRVIMGLEEKALVSGSILMYLLPLLFMIVGAIVFSNWITIPGSGWGADAMASLGLGVGLVLGLGITRGLSNRMRRHLYPKIMRIQSDSR